MWLDLKVEKVFWSILHNWEDRRKAREGTDSPNFHTCVKQGPAVPVQDGDAPGPWTNWIHSYTWNSLLRKPITWPSGSWTPGPGTGMPRGSRYRCVPPGQEPDCAVQVGREPSLMRDGTHSTAQLLRPAFEEQNIWLWTRRMSVPGSHRRRGLGHGRTHRLAHGLGVGRLRLSCFWVGAPWGARASWRCRDTRITVF